MTSKHSGRFVDEWVATWRNAASSSGSTNASGFAFGQADCGDRGRSAADGCLLRELTTSLGLLRVISPEGLIGFKLQAVVNDPRRTQDIEDIRALLRANRDKLDLEEVREYFRLFDREALLDDILAEIG
jgi:hypothetical protein